MAYFFHSIQPYSKYIALGLVVLSYITLLIVFYLKISKDQKLKDWIMGSLSDGDNLNKASGKALTALLFSKIIALASIVSFIWSPTHLMPDYYFISLITLIAAVYGLKLATKWAGGSGSSNTDDKNKTPDNTQQ